MENHQRYACVIVEIIKKKKIMMVAIQCLQATRPASAEWYYRYSFIFDDIVVPIRTVL